MNTIAKELTRVPGFDEIVFENRNKAYGAYDLRKKYYATLLVAFMMIMVLLVAAVYTPYYRSSARRVGQEKEMKKEVFIRMERFEQPEEEIIRVQAPPPPPQTVLQQQIRYIAPEVVDTVMPTEKEAQIMTMDESVKTIQDEQVAGVIEYVPEGEIEDDYIPVEEPIFFIVEEMPTFQGNEQEAFRIWIAQNLRYPEIALENGISGKVYVQFSINSKGDVVDAIIVRGVDPALDKEAVRVVMSSPRWTPGRQRGTPVKVQFTFPINFVIQ